MFVVDPSSIAQSAQRVKPSKELQDLLGILDGRLASRPYSLGESRSSGDRGVRRTAFRQVFPNRPAAPFVRSPRCVLRSDYRSLVDQSEIRGQQTNCAISELRRQRPTVELLQGESPCGLDLPLHRIIKLLAEFAVIAFDVCTRERGHLSSRDAQT